jgi:UDP-glucose 4-epimerase
VRKVFVTGVAGFLGSHVAERFQELGWEVVGIDNMQGGQRANVPDGIRFEVVDCLDRGAYLPLLRGADVVYHCASAAYDGLSVFAPAFVYRHTAQATVEVASAAVSSDVGRFVHCSSMARYGALPTPFTEDMEPAPVNPYGLAKHASELVVANLFDTHGGEYCIAVPHNIIGPRQRFDDPYRNVASIMINRMLRGLQPVIYGDGSNLRCFSFVDDVIYCLEQMGTADVAAGETINIGPDEGAITILGLAEVIADLMAFSLDPIFVEARPQEVERALCSADKARRLLGYDTKTTLREGLQSMLEWIDRQGPCGFNYDLDIEILTDRTPAPWVRKLI